MLVCGDWLDLAAKVLWRDASVLSRRCVQCGSRRLPLYATAIHTLAIPRKEDIATDLQPWSFLPRLSGLLLSCEYLSRLDAFISLLARCNAVLLASVKFSNIFSMFGTLRVRNDIWDVHCRADVVLGKPATIVLLRLAQCPALLELKLSKTVLGHDVVAAIVERSVHPFPRLQKLEANVHERSVALLLGMVEPTGALDVVGERDAREQRRHGVGDAGALAAAAVPLSATCPRQAATDS